MKMQPKDSATVSVRFAGDSGDGMQLAGDRFTHLSAAMGNEVITVADYPAEIRSPAGTIGGVSGYQLNVGACHIYTPGDRIDILIAMNPAALSVNLKDVKEGGLIVVNVDSFTDKNLEKAKYLKNPLEDNTLARFRVLSVPVTKLTREALKDSPLGLKDRDRCRNFFSLGLACWLLSRDTEPILKWISEKFEKKPDIADANRACLEAGYHWGTMNESIRDPWVVRKANLNRKPGTYRCITGNVALSLGLVTAKMNSKRGLFLGSYPITPASDILHELCKYKHFGVTTFQAEDEIGAIGAAIGASYAGALAATSTSGPGFCLKTELINFAVMTELPLVIINVQRAGPSTGMPTKTEQADLLQAMWGRSGESPIVVLAARSPADCFEVAYEAARVAMTYMTPVIVLSDGYLANGSEGWRIREPGELKEMPSTAISVTAEDFQPYKRDPETLARPWIKLGTAGYCHCIGGLEKSDLTGKTSHNPENHQRMVELRAEKVKRVQQEIPPSEIIGDINAKILVIGWGSTYGPIRSAVENLVARGRPVAYLHLRYINPFPKDLENILKRYETILVPENNLGQLSIMLRAEYCVPVKSFAKVQGNLFRIEEIEAKIDSMLGNKQ